MMSKQIIKDKVWDRVGTDIEKAIVICGAVNMMSNTEIANIYKGRYSTWATHYLHRNELLLLSRIIFDIFFELGEFSDKKEGL